jgi:hypothetical protein
VKNFFISQAMFCPKSFMVCIPSASFFPSPMSLPMAMD